MDINNELEEMRSQIALLKEKLDNEKIVNDKILRNATKTKIRSLRINQIMEYVSALFVITFGSVVFLQLLCILRNCQQVAIRHVGAVKLSVLNKCHDCAE